MHLADSVELRRPPHTVPHSLPKYNLAHQVVEEVSPRERTEMLGLQCRSDIWYRLAPTGVSRDERW